jgi:hypothetical protein
LGCHFIGSVSVVFSCFLSRSAEYWITYFCGCFYLQFWGNSHLTLSVRVPGTAGYK